MNRNTGHRPRIAGVDAIAVAPMLLCMYHPTRLTILVLAVSVCILWSLEQYGYYITSLAPLVRWWLGSKNPDLHVREKRPVW